MNEWKRVYCMGAWDAFQKGNMIDGTLITIIFTRGWEVFKNGESIKVYDKLDEAYDEVEKHVKM